MIINIAITLNNTPKTITMHTGVACLLKMLDSKPTTQQLIDDEIKNGDGPPTLEGYTLSDWVADIICRRVIEAHAANNLAKPGEIDPQIRLCTQTHVSADVS